VTPSKVKVYYVGADGETRVESKLVAGKYVDEVSTAAGGSSVKFQVNSKDSKTLTIDLVSGTYKASTYTSTSAAANAAYGYVNFSDVQGKTDRAVVVKITGLDSLTTMYTITDTATATAKAIEDWDSTFTTATYKDYTLKVQAAKSTVNEGGSVKLTATLGTAMTTSAPIGIKVTLTNGTEFLFTNTANDTATATLTNVTSDVTLGIASVTAVAVPNTANAISKVMYVDANGNGTMDAGDKVVITFKSAVDSAPTVTKSTFTSTDTLNDAKTELTLTIDTFNAEKLTIAANALSIGGLTNTKAIEITVPSGLTNDGQLTVADAT
jgi:hypothetical protein